MIEFAMLCSIIVFPALGGEIINDLCPFPIGLTRSINLGVRSGFFSILVVSTSITVSYTHLTLPTKA